MSDGPKGAWMTIHTDELLKALRRVDAGEAADDVMLSLYMESEHDFYK